jgi:lysophospholipase L1-like esterase
MPSVRTVPQEITADAGNPIVLKNVNGGTLYLGGYNVSSTNSLSTLAVGASVTLVRPTFIVSASETDYTLAAGSTTAVTYVEAPVASRAQPPGTTGASNATDTTGNTRLRHVSPIALTRIKVRYHNLIDTANVEADNANAVTFRDAIEYPVGVYHPLYFNGKRDATLDGGAAVESDWLTLLAPIPANTAFYSRTFHTVGAGGVWAYTCLKNTAYTEACSSSTSDTDLTTSGSIVAAQNGGFGPVAIISDQVPSTLPRVFFAGDSITLGYKDTVNSIGWTARGMEGIALYQRVAMFGELARDAATVDGFRRRLTLAKGCNVGCVAYGTNDIAGARTLGQIQADLQTIGNGLLGVGMSKVYIVTMPPRTSSTDAWVTTANQTRLATEATRITVNDWIRTVPTPFSGVLELADVVETDIAGVATRNGGYWRANWSDDGVHGNPVSYAAIAATMVPATVLVP